MNTGIRRFILRLVVGVLTFAIGVGAAILLGGFSIFRSHSTTTYETNRGCAYRRHSRLYSSEAPSAFPATILLKGPRGIRMGTELNALPPTPPATNAPVPPNPPIERR